MVFLLEVGLRILIHVEVLGELAVVVDLVLGHGVVVDIEPFEDQDQDVGQFLDGLSFEGGDFLVALFTEEGIVPLHHFPGHKRIEAIEDGLLIFDGQVDRQEQLLGLAVVAADLADQLVCVFPPERVFDHLLLLGAFELVLELVQKVDEELVGVHLLQHVDRLVLGVFEGLAEPTGIIVLLVAFQQRP